MKRVDFVGTSLEDLRAFPASARREMGHDLERVQRGLEARNWKPFKSVASGVREIRVRVAEGVFRAIYVAVFEEAVYVLHAFRKSSDRTARRDVELAEQRYAALLTQRSRGARR